MVDRASGADHERDDEAPKAGVRGHGHVSSGGGDGGGHRPVTGRECYRPGPHRTTRKHQHPVNVSCGEPPVPVRPGNESAAVSRRRRAPARLPAMAASRGPRPARPPDRRTSARRRPRRPARSCASRRPARARRRPWSRGSPGSSTRAPTRRRSRRSPSTSARPRSSASGWTRPSRRSAWTPATVRVRTFHALGREILRDAGVDVRDLVDRATAPGRGRARPRPRADVGRYDTAFSRLKLELRVDPRDDRRRSRTPGPIGAGVRRATRRRSRRAAALDFDDLVRRALDRLDGRPGAARPLARTAARISSSTRSRTSTGRQLRAGAAPGGPGEPDLPRRRRRPVDLRLAAGRRAPGPGPRRGAARACGGSTSRSTTAARRRSSSAPSGSSSTTSERFAKVDPQPRPGRRGPRRPRPGRRRRTGPDDPPRSARGRTTTARGRSSPGRTASCARPSSRHSPWGCRSARPRVDLLVDDPRLDDLLRARRAPTPARLAAPRPRRRRPARGRRRRTTPSWSTALLGLGGRRTRTSPALVAADRRRPRRGWRSSDATTPD